MGFIATTHLSGVIVSIYTWCFFNMSFRFVELLHRPSRRLTAILSVLNGVLCVGLIAQNAKISDMYIIAVIALVLECTLVVNGDIEMQLLMALHTGLHLVAVRCFSICLVALISPATIFQVITSSSFRFESFMVFSCIMFAFLVSNSFFLRPDRLRFSFKHKRQTRLVYGSAIVLCLYQLLCIKAFYYTIELIWFSVLQLLSSVFILVGYYFIFLCSASVGEWVNTAVLNAQLEQNLRLQLSHYEAYARSERAIKIFKHDYKNLVLTVSALLVNNKTEQALAVLEQMDHKLQQDVLVHRVYSSNVHINAALQELANECLAQNIKFNAGVVLPSPFEKDRYAISALFAAMTKIALDCCKKTQGAKVIEVFTSTSNQWLTLTMEFSCPSLEIANEVRASLNNTIEKLTALSFIEKNNGFLEINCGNSMAKTCIHLNIPKEEGDGL